MDLSEPQAKKPLETVLPMINIVFLLLIFFMLAGAFIKTDALPIVVPEAEFGTEANLDKLIIVMSVNNEFAIDTTIYDKDSLVSFIRNKKAESNIKTALLKADKLVKANDLMDVMSLLSDAGLESVQLMSLKVSHH